MPIENESISLPELPDRVPHNAETLATIPHTSAEFRTAPKAAEEFGKVPQVAERKENHTLTVRETARMFETAGVARTERSIVNWCQQNRTGIARLDSYFDPNERKYFLTPESVERAIQEEKDKGNGVNGAAPVGKVPKTSEDASKEHAAHSEGGSEMINNLKMELLDLKILNGGKDFLIQQLRDERDGFFDQLLTANRKMGKLESKLNQLEEPQDDVV